MEDSIFQGVAAAPAVARFVPFTRFVPDGADASRPAILVAESEPDLCHVLGHLLRDASYRASFATDGITAVTAVARDVPDLLVLDLNLARLDGLLTLELVRAIAGTVPVVLISSDASPALDRAAARLGVLAVLRKPFRNAELLDAVARGLECRSGMAVAAGSAGPVAGP